MKSKKQSNQWILEFRAGTYKIVRNRLIRWWINKIDGDNLFPWRSPATSPYQALITEMLLQRTRAEAVSGIYFDFFRKFPDARSIFNSTEEEISAMINCLGLSGRSRRLKELGAAIIEGIPENIELLLQLPSIGPYAAGAFLSLHRKKRAIIPDANMVRVTGRIFGFQFNSETRRKRAFLELCEKITPSKKFREFNYSILDFGRIICKPRTPSCDDCFLHNTCVYRKNKHCVKIPLKLKKRIHEST